MHKKKHLDKKENNSKKHKDKTVTYVRVDNPLIIRKSVLQSAIWGTQLLRNYERYKALKEEKIVRSKQLVEIFNEIEALFRRLRTIDLPVFDRIEQELKKSEVFKERMFAPPTKTKVLRPQRTLRQEARIVEPKKVISTEERLDIDIKDIQDKLNNLDV